LSVSKNDSVDPLIIGNETIYTIRISNVGSTAVNNVVLSDPLPSGMIFKHAPSNCSVSGRVVRCVFPAIGVFGRAEAGIRVQAAGPAGAVTNSVTVTSSNAPTVSGSERTTIVAAQRVPDSRGANLMFKGILDIEPNDGSAESQIVVNGSASQQIANSGPRSLRVNAIFGKNVLEALPPVRSTRSGLWRFDFAGVAEFVPGSIRVESGQVVSIDGSAAVFRASSSTPAVRFSFELREPNQPGTRRD